MTNIVLLVGNVGDEPSTLNSGNTDICKFSLATSRVKRDSEGKTFKDASGFTARDTEWHRITCFNGLGRTVAQHVTKGMQVSVRGRIRYSRYTDREGIERYGCEIIADEVNFLGRPKTKGQPAGSGSSGSDLDDDVPF